jgi:nucleoside-diphosphate-sugar epimerase
LRPIADGSGDGKVLVVGGAGYIGSVLTRALLEAERDVRVLDSLLYSNGDSLAAISDDPGFSFVEGDIRSPDDVRSALDGIDSVVLLASLVGDPVCKLHPELAKETNLGGARNVLEASAAAGVERLVFASTCSNYGLRPDNEPADEEQELHPLSLYAETKVEMEGEVIEASSKSDLVTTVLRVATAFGLSPRMRFDLTVSEFTRELALGHELEVYDPDTWRPYCHVADISAAIQAVLAAPADDVRGEVFNVGGEGANQTKRMIVEAALAALGGDGKVAWTEGGTDARNYKVSFAKIRERLGYEPKRSVADGIEELIAAIRSGTYDDVDSRPLYHHNFELEGETVGEGTGGGDAG